MPTDDDDAQRDTSTILDLGESLLNGLGNGQTGTEWRAEVEDQLGGDLDVDYDRLATAGVAAGEQIARIRQQARDTASTDGRRMDEPSTLTETRDTYSDSGEYIGTRLYVSDPKADVYLSADGSEVVIKVGKNATTEPLPQPADGIAVEDDSPGGVSLFVAYPEGSPLQADDLIDDTDGVSEVDTEPSPDDKWADETRTEDDA